MALKDRLKDLRTRKHLSQMELATELHVSPGAIGGYENGTRTPKPDILTRMADYFGVSEEYLLYGSLLNAKQRQAFLDRIEEPLESLSYDDQEMIGINAAEIFNALHNGMPIREDKAVRLAKELGTSVESIFSDPYYTTHTEDQYFGDNSREAVLQQAFDARPEMRVLFSSLQNASKDDIETAIRIIEALKDKS